MRRSRSRVVSIRRWCGGVALALLVSLGTAPSAGADKSDNEAREQLKFGVDMARRGLWSEALFRFEQVRKLRPGDPKVLNNLAVAYEAVGRFDDAEAAYRDALKVAPSNKDIKKNVVRFREFLQNFRAKKTPSDAPAVIPAVIPPVNPAANPAVNPETPKEGR